MLSYNGDLNNLTFYGVLLMAFRFGCLRRLFFVNEGAQTVNVQFVMFVYYTPGLLLMERRKHICGVLVHKSIPAQSHFHSN